MSRSSAIRVLFAAALLAAAVPSPAFAQKFAIGVRSGFDLATLSGEVAEELDTRLAPSLGGFFMFRFAKLFAIQSELMYVEKGAEQDFPFFPGPDNPDIIASGNFKLALDYLELQVPLTLMIPVGGERVVPRLYAGPVVSLQLGCQVSLASEIFTLLVGCDNRIPTEEGGTVQPFPTESIDFGILGGAGFDVGLGPGLLTTDVRYNYGLRDIATAEAWGSIKNRNLQFLIGYAYYFGG